MSKCSTQKQVISVFKRTMSNLNVAATQPNVSRITFWEVIKCPYYLQLIAGISPYVRKGNQLVSTTLVNVYSTLLIVLFVFFVTVSIRLIRDEGFEWLNFNHGYLWIIIVCFELTFTVITFPIMLVYCQFSKREQIWFIIKIEEIDSLLIDEFEVSFNQLYSSFRIRQYVELGGSSLYYIIIYLVLRSILQFYELTSIGFELFSIVYVWEQAISGLMTFSFMNSSIVLSSKFAMLKQIQQTIETNVCLSASVTKRKLSILMTTFKDVCQIIEMISQQTGVVLILRYSHDFTLLTSQCYMIYFLLTEYQDEWTMKKLMTFLVWMVQNVVRIGLTSYRMHSTVSEVRMGTYCNKRIDGLHFLFLGLFLRIFDHWS